MRKIVGAILAVCLSGAPDLLAAVSITNGGGTATAGVDTNSNLQVREPTTPAQAGLTGLLGHMDDGSSRVDSPNNPYTKRVFVSENGRIGVGQDTHIAVYEFPAAAVNSGKWFTPATTQTVDQNAGYLRLNASGITTINTNSAVRTQRYFTLFGRRQLSVEVQGYMTVTQTNQLVEFGLMSATLPGAGAPADGVFFRYNASNELRGVVNFNGTETQTASIPLPSTNVNHNYFMRISDDAAEFWIDDKIVAEIEMGATIPGQGTPFISVALPFVARYVIGGSAPAIAARFQMSGVSIYWSDGQVARTEAEITCGMGQNCSQGQDGGTMGTTANYANSANPTSAAGSNTAANVTGLGGQGAINAAAGAATDYIATSFQNPAGTTAIPGRTLYITGVKISSVNMGAAVATTQTTLAWSLAHGHTAVSMATAESLTSATKAPRRIALGFQSAAVGTAVGGTYAPGDVSMTFNSPIVVNPGEFIATVVKQIVGTATASQSIWYHVTFNGYFE